MALSRLQGVVVLVVALAGLQVTFEQVVVFSGATGGTESGVVAFPLVIVAVSPLAGSLLLVLLVGGALGNADTPR